MVNWFDRQHLKNLPIKYINDLHGYVLPHAGTAYTGHILSHTLRFRPVKTFTNILIIYYPAYKKENVKYNNKQYYHEFYVVFRALQHYFKGFTIDVNTRKKKKIYGFNVRDNTTTGDISHLNLENTLYVVSADFSHHKPLQFAISKENCAAHSIMHRYLTLKCSDVIDHVDSFKSLYKMVPSNVILQWVGRTRSPGRDKRDGTGQGVGYLSFLMREQATYGEQPHHKRKPDGFFVTAYDREMRQRECLGNTKMWSKQKEQSLTRDVINKANTTSRLTGGRYIGVPVTHYTVTYLFIDRQPKQKRNTRKHRNGTMKHRKNLTKAKKFIRGWHAIMKDALYLPDVFLENTYDNGRWIKQEDVEWPQEKVFKLNDTFKKLGIKSRRYTRKYMKHKPTADYTLFYSDVKHVKI